MAAAAATPLRKLLSCVILDLDGTLLNTDGIVGDVLKVLIVKYGKQWDAKVVHRIVGADFVLQLLSMDFFNVSEAEKLTDASINGEFRSHLNHLIIYLPDDCPQASDVMLSFLSSLVDAELVLHLSVGRVIGTLEKNMCIDARKLRLLRRLLIYRYPDQCPRLLLKGFEGINLSEWPEIYREEERKHDQAKYARRVNVAHKRRFLRAQSSKAGSFDRKCGMGLRSRKGRLSGSGYGSHSNWLQKLQMENMFRVIRLNDVTILPKIGGQCGETIVGTLEAQANRFVYLVTRNKSDRTEKI